MSFIISPMFAVDYWKLGATCAWWI